jgi:solute carrier family 25 protein 14/30
MTQRNDLLPKFAAGGISCCILSAILNPFDLTKVRLQISNQLQKQVVEKHFLRAFADTAKDIVKKEGVLVLWTRGLAPSMLREGIYSSIRLGLYDPIRDHLVKDDKTHIPLSKKILAGFLSGGLGACMVNPADLVKIRFQGELGPSKYKHTFDAFNQIYKQEGVKNGLYRGVGATTLRAGVLTSAQMSSYDHSKYLILKHGLMVDGPQLHFLCAGISGLVATICTSPVDVIKTRIMHDKGNLYKNSMDCLIKTIRVEGMTAMFKGFLPNYLRLGPHLALSLPLYEQLRKLFGVGTLHSQ